MTWSETFDGRPVPFWESVAADIRAQIPEHEQPASRLMWLPLASKVALFSSGFRAVLNYRIAHLAQAKLGLAGKPVGKFCFWFGRHWYGCAIAPTARLYGGLVLPHPQGIVIGAGTVIGPRAWVFQNVTLGGGAATPGMPRVGSDARLYTGAVIVGPVVLGDQVVVGANAVVAKDVPTGTTVRAPASELRQRA